jgi:hypothetical protein
MVHGEQADISVRVAEADANDIVFAIPAHHWHNELRSNSTKRPGRSVKTPG